MVSSVHRKNLVKTGYILTLILLLTIFLYDNVKGINKAKEGFTIEKYMENPQKFGGIKFEHMARIINISQDHFYVNLGNRDLKVMGSGIKRPIYGETLVYVHYRKDGIIELIDYHNYDYNYFLYIISFFAFIVFIIIFLKEWKITWRGFEDA
tara:strand:+ start:1211 stop:1666 length:456 start_codon:yes stop_codon:yes gene_type:complete